MRDRRRQTTSRDVERSRSSRIIRRIYDDVTDDDDDDIRTRLVQLSRNDQLGFGFSAAGQRPTTIRSVIKGNLREVISRVKRLHGV